MYNVSTQLLHYNLRFRVCRYVCSDCRLRAY
ncbi:unnamed protein product [Acanthoscelides obtectus]|uniref:Uncharacterized protein n=1 Tax=Acanthoscelides obtectus TaxID=200917 RepID=A0A9P0JZF3_ACAOB|nr:unnamed protein product [Acanthoscelides obtectus]CAK1669719.1 hypothetical protein AOBTE_LOCUS27201 [Acanthoscelides obtectus]